MSLDVGLFYEIDGNQIDVYDRNITHNLGEMANAAGVYKHLWHPEELGITIAAELTEALRNALSDMRARPDFYKQYNPENGWGSYDGLVNFIKEYLEACEKYPNAKIYISR